MLAKSSAGFPSTKDESWKVMVGGRLSSSSVVAVDAAGVDGADGDGPVDQRVGGITEHDLHRLGRLVVVVEDGVHRESDAAGVAANSQRARWVGRPRGVVAGRDGGAVLGRGVHRHILAGGGLDEIAAAVAGAQHHHEGQRAALGGLGVLDAQRGRGCVDDGAGAVAVGEARVGRPLGQLKGQPHGLVVLVDGVGACARSPCALCRRRQRHRR